MSVWAQTDDLNVPLPQIGASPSPTAPSPAPAPSSGATPVADPAAGDDCGLIDFACKAQETVSGFFNDQLADLGNSVLEAVGGSAAAIGTAWVGIPTPNLTDGGNASTNWETPPEAGQLTDILGWATWLGFGVAVLGLIVWGARFAWVRSGDSDREMGRMGAILGGVVIIGAASGIVAALLPNARAGSEASSTVAFLQNSLMFFTAALAVLSVIIGGIKLAWEQRAQPGIDLVRSLLTLVLVSAVGVSIAGILVVVSDEFSNWILDRSLDCGDATTDACFGQNVVTLFAPLMASGIGVFLVIIGGIVAIMLTFVQVMLMLTRSAMLVVLVGILPLSAAATNTEMGRAWFRKNVAWLLGFALYKPAISIIYSTGFLLMGTFDDNNNGMFSGDSPIVAMAAGFMLLLLSIIALPALMRFVTPMVGAVGAGGGAAAIGAGAAAALPTGAMAVGKASRGGGSDGGSGSKGPSGASSAGGGAGGGSNPQPGGGSGGGPSGGGGSKRGGGSGGGSSGGGSGADVDLTESSSPTGGQRGGGAPVPAGVTPGGGGPSGGGAVSGGGAKGAGAAGGPAGVAVEAGAEGARRTLDKGRQIADDAAGDQGGPDGSK